MRQPAARPVPASVLIVKLAAIGDVAMALPMVTALRARDPGARVAWLAGATVAPLLRAVDGVDEVLVVDDDGDSLRHAGPQDAGGARRVARAVGAELRPRADRAHRPPVQAADRPRARQRATLARRALAASGPGAGALVPRRIRPARDRDRRSPRRRPAPPRVRVALDDAVGARLAALPPGRRIALAPGGARNAARESPLRRWPLERYARAGGGTGRPRRHRRRHRRPRRRLGPPGIRRHPGRRRRSGRRRCRASSRSTQAAPPSSPTTPARCTSRTSRRRASWACSDRRRRRRSCARTRAPRRCGTRPDLPCAPCYDGRDFADCSDNLCLQRIDVAAVLARLDTLLAA